MDARNLTPLPSELLADIFEWYIEMDGSPWRLVEVCRQWNDIALSTGRLWRSITIIQDSMDHERRTYDGDSASQICCHPTDVRIALGRAASSLLNLTVTFSSTPMIDQRIRRGDANIFTLLASIVSRCESLYLKTFYTTPEVHPHGYLELVDLPALDRLRSLTIGPNWRNRHILNKVLDASQRAPRGLDELRLESPAIYPDLSQYPHAAQQIRHLELISTSPTSNELENLLCPLQNLLYMRSTAQVEWKNQLRLNTVSHGAQLLPSMTEWLLHQTRLNGWSGLQLPSLRNLQIDNCDINNSPYSIELPVLETLVLRQEVWAAAFRAFLCPELDKLTLCGGPKAIDHANMELSQTFTFDRRQPTPRLLSIHVRADGENLISSLRRISSLEGLEVMVDDDLRADMLREILFAALSDVTHGGAVSNASNQGVLLPSLRKVTIRYQSQSQIDSPTGIDNAMVSWRKVKRAREALGDLHRQFECVVFNGDVKVRAFSLLDDDSVLEAN